MRNYKEFLVRNISIGDALQRMELNGNGILFVIDSYGKIEGSLSDGDCRRHFLGGGTKADLIEEVMNREVCFLHVSAPISDKMQLATNFGALPLVDDLGVVQDIFIARLSKTIQVSNPSLKGNEAKYLLECVESGWISSGGKFVRDFENALGKYLGGLNCVLVSNGTVALQLAMTSMGIGEGDEVIVPDLTFGATINAVLAVGAIPKIVAVERDNWNLDITQLMESISANTKAVIAVDLYGVRCVLDDVLDELQQNGIKVIVDAAESMATYLSDGSCKLADAYTLSFFANKIITTGEGGAILFKSDLDKNRAMVQRDHGMSKERRYFHVDKGFNYRLTNMQAAVGMAQLERIDEILLKRKEIFGYYLKHLKNLPGVLFQESISSASPWLFTFSIKGVNINELQAMIADKGVDTRRIFIPLSNMEVFSKFSNSNCANSTEIYNSSISLPTYTELNRKEQFEIINIVKSCIELLRLSQQEAEVKA